MIILGLTGSIGMGKSTAASMLLRFGIPLFDADRVVHGLLAPGGGAVREVADAFPGVRAERGGIDRALLGQRVFADIAELKRLEGILHPKVRAEEKRFLGGARARRKRLAVLDIPLLFETAGERRCDYVIVVSAPALVQRQRVMRRPGMTEIRLAAILQQQISDREKRQRADFVVPTGLGRKLTLCRLRTIVRLFDVEWYAPPPPRRARCPGVAAEKVMREIVLDTETTGLDPKEGHRIVEIACIELAHHVPTGRKFHRYVNPERDMPAEALAVHGITAEFLASQPLFGSIIDELLSFIGSDRLVIHNADFDLAFLNGEFARLGRDPISCAFIDTLGLARVRFPGAPASLDALCRRFGIDLSQRVEHGAKIDCDLLAAVYLELLGGRQPALEFARPSDRTIAVERILREPRPHAPTPEELIAHQAMLQIVTAPIWLMEA